MKYHLELDIDFKRNPYPGKFIVIEGIDAAGKTTHVNLLSQYLPKKYKVFVTKNPTKGEVGQFIKRALRGEFPTNPITIQYLHAADRAIQQQDIIEHLKKGEVVISDRYFWSSLAYGLADKKEVDFDKELEVLTVALSVLSFYHQFIVPDLTIYIDIKAETAVERLKKVHAEKEIYDDLEILKRVKRAYHWVNKKFEDKIVLVSGERSIEEVDSDIKKQVEKLLQ